MKVIHQISLLLTLIIAVSTPTGTVAASSIQDDDQNGSGSRSMTLTLVVNSISPKCYGEHTGSASVQIIGGVPPFTTTWMPGGMNTTVVTGLAAGIYSVKVKDSTGTSVQVNLQISQPAQLTATAEIVSPACAPVAEISVGANGGSLPYSGTGMFQSGAGNFNYAVTDAKGCSVNGSIPVVIQTPPMVSVTGDTATLCAGSTTTLIANATPGASLLWNTGEISNTIQTGNAGNYYVVATNANGCSSESDHFEVKVHSTPIISVSMNGDTLKTGDAVSYQWYFEERIVPTATERMHVARSVGSYNVAVTDANGCTARSADVYVSSLSNSVATGISELGEEGVVVRSNPSVNGNWAITANTDLIGSNLEVLDNNGQLVYSSVVTNQNVSLDLNASKGVYLLHIRSGNQDITRKLIRL